MKDLVLTMADGQELYIIEDMDFMDAKYVIGALVNLDKDEIDDENLIVQEVIQESDGVRLIGIEDQTKAEAITKLLISKIHMSEEE